MLKKKYSFSNLVNNKQKARKQQNFYKIIVFDYNTGI